MDDKIQNTIKDLAAVADDVAASFGSLTDDQLNWKPAAESWSIAQCLDHLIKTDDLFEPEFKKLAAGGRKNTLWQSLSPFSGFFGRFLIRTLDNDSKKTKAPSQDIVPPSEIEPGIVGRFTGHIAEVNRGIEAAGNVDLRRTVVSSPFFRPITYTLGDALSILVSHHRRHVRQAKRVMENEGFPK